MVKHIRRQDLGISFMADGAMMVRAPTAGVGARVPPIAVAILAFCSTPRSAEEVQAVFGPNGASLFAGLADAGLLIAEGSETDTTPVFFQNFASVDTHRRMLADRVRLDAYERALAQVVEPGMAVMDAGTGSGVLAVLAAAAGARRVYGVDNAEVLEHARQVVERSGYTDTVSLVRGDFARVALPEPVDVLVTETFGAFALCEGSVPDVHAAATQNLSAGGRTVPSAIQYWLAPVGDPAVLDEITTPFAHPTVNLSALEEASMWRGITLSIPETALLAPGIQLARVPYPDGGDVVEGSITFRDLPEGQLVGLAGWFALELSPDVVLGTGPSDPETHWHQVFLPLRPVGVPEGSELQITLRAEPAADDRRGLELNWQWRLGAEQGRALHRLR